MTNNEPNVKLLRCPKCGSDGDDFTRYAKSSCYAADCPAHERALNTPGVDAQGVNEADETLRLICELFLIGEQARTPGAILTNVRNAKRFADMLHAVEREFFMVPGEPDEDYPNDEFADECLVSRWGSTTEQYVDQFRAALAKITAAPTGVYAAGKVEALAKLAEDCADSLEADLNARYSGTLHYPSMKARYDADMRDVIDLRAALAALAEGEEEHDRKWANYGTPVDESKVTNVEGEKGNG